MSETVVKKKPVSRKRVGKKSGKLEEKNPIILAEKGTEGRELYLQWAAIPASLRNADKTVLKKMGYDIEDEEFMKLIAIRTKGKFCEEFGYNKNMPARWEKDPEFIDRMNEIAHNSHVMRFKKDIDFSFTQKTLRHGDAQRQKLWKQLYEGWSEKTENVNVNLNMTPADIVAQIEARNKDIRGG
jgi:hypothetical protein